MEKILSASILSASFANLESTIRECEAAGVDWIHIDVMDGHFVPNLTMGPFIVREIRKITNLALDCHLMIEKPESLVSAFAEAGATHITIHPENNPNVLRTLKFIKELGAHPGLAINPGTSTSIIDPLLPFLDMILVMTVNPGFSGQTFIDEMIEKVQQARSMIETSGRNILLQVDGGINADNAGLLVNAGANVFVSASSIFNHKDGITEGVNKLRKAIDS